MNETKKIAVIFPGIGYTNDKPLLYYTKKLAQKKNYRVITLNFDGFPENIFGSKAKIKEAGNIAFEQAQVMLSDINWQEYNTITFISKSIGTIAAAQYAKENKILPKQILLTPLENTFKYTKNFSSQAIAFHGTEDPWISNEKFNSLTEGQSIAANTYEQANHSLETGNVFEDLKILKDVLKKINKAL